ncbi:hypothetical protein CFK37_01585 [Virgibacillus phasianinus]|uniref:Uncharacterized protein n=1 Tax=Virgibacillus phasianinus TaxID=2017483 RepID=A0A220TYD2_9BACI|nr:hypothetical protein [Virgibacillus phasianinus]ASK60994.1 hypothetical protein CFK37_01585 [Virgibacillus phasianinus]
MKEKFVLGIALFMSGTLLVGIMHLAIALYIPSLEGWTNPPGKFSTVMTEIMGWFPYILSIILMVAGITVLIFHYKKEWQSYLEKWESNKTDEKS